VRESKRLAAVTLYIYIGNYTVRRHGYVGDPALYTIMGPDGRQVGEPMLWAKVEAAIADDTSEKDRAAH
jgi:hypothetical protein